MTALTFVRKAFVRVQLPAILWALLIFTGSSIPGEQFPDLSIFAYDKAFHFVFFGFFCYFLYRSLRYQSRFPRLAYHAPWVAFLATVGYGIFDELHQVFVPGRSPDPFDLLADSLGAFVATLILQWVERSGSRKRSST